MWKLHDKSKDIVRLLYYLKSYISITKKVTVNASAHKDFEIILTVVILKSRSTFFGLLRKSSRGKSKLKMRLILAIFGEFVRFFENSKNQKVQTLGGATFGDTPMY